MIETKKPKSHFMFSAMTGLFKYLQYPNHNLLFAGCLQACFALLTSPSSIVHKLRGQQAAACAGICDLVSQQAAASEGTQMDWRIGAQWANLGEFIKNDMYTVHTELYENADDYLFNKCG